MSFLVSYGGQFKIYNLPESFHYERIHPTGKLLSNKKVQSDDETEFQKNFHQKANPSIAAYKSQEKKHINIESSEARDIMTHSLKTLKETATIQDALSLMEKNYIHHLPILGENQDLVGIISDRDLLKQQNRNMQLIDIMQREVVVCAIHTKIPVLASVMLHEGIHCMPVINAEKELIGIVTQTDILKALLNSDLLKVWSS